MTKDDVSAGENKKKKLTWFHLMGLPKYIEIGKDLKIIGISCFKVEKWHNSNTWFF